MTFTLHHGDCIEVMRGMDAQSVHCCVTSPPYWGLRDYGVDGQIGLESTPEEYVGKMVEVFREVRRVLRDDGTLWLNLGDSYSMNTRGARGKGKQHTNNGSVIDDRHWAIPAGLKPKDLVGIPWRVAFALQADGWYLRQDIIWHKPNPMPESVRDRCTKAHEYVFLLSKSARYYFDADAIAAPSINAGMVITYNNPKEITDPGYDGHRTRKGMHGRDILVADTRNRRSVWTVASSPFPDAHFATFPEPLIQPCILAGCPKGGIVLDPFGGAGTTGVTCKRMDRQSVLIELNQEYAEMARKRIDDTHVQQKLAL